MHLYANAEHTKCISIEPVGGRAHVSNEEADIKPQETLPERLRVLLSQCSGQSLAPNLLGTGMADIGVDVVDFGEGFDLHVVSDALIGAMCLGHHERSHL